MTPDELLLLIAEHAQRNGVYWHIDSYTTTRATAERLLRTMAIIPTNPPRALPAQSETQELPLYLKGVARR